MNSTEWQWTMKKPQVPLAQGLHFIAIPLMQKNLSIETDLPIKHVNGDIYFGKKAIKDIFEQLEEKISKDPTYPDKIQQKIESAINQLKETVKELKAFDPSKQTDNDLITSFMKGYNAIAEVTAFMSFKGTVQMSDVLEAKMRTLLESKIQGAEELNNVFLLLSLPEKDSLMIQERKSILKIGSELQKGNDVITLLEQHTKQFGWMGCIMYAGRPYTKEHFQQELQQAVKQDCLQQLKEMEEKKKEREQKIEQQIKKLGFTEEEKYLLKQFRSWAHIRTYVKDMTSVGMEPTLPFLDEIAQRAGVSYTNLLYLSHTELQEIFSDKKDALIQESKKRQKGWGMMLANGKIRYYNHENVTEIEEDEEKIPAGVKGFPACSGIVRGNAVIVKTVHDLEQVKQGDVLITHMTTTNFVPLLSKVAAIVTDEGGITCHAAIVSREMNIPCVIGTKIGTKAFKNGDLVEVDANKGIVRKVK